MRRLVLHAEAELISAVDHYERISPGLGLDLYPRVYRAFRAIQKNPERYPFHKETRIRRCLLSRFPYTIYYLESGERISVIAVAHRKRKPDYWRERTTD